MNKARNILITGASRGLGKAMAEHYLAQGHMVYGCSRSEKTIDDKNYAHFEVDITSEDDITAMFIALRKQAGHLDALINNAGIASMNAFALTPLKSFRKIFETNVQGTIRLTHALIDGMLARGSGHIVNMGSIAGLKPYASGTAYVSSKYAVHGFSETLRLDYAGRGIRVTEIMPGLVRSGFAAQRLGDEREAKAFYDSFEQCLQPEDIAQTVLYALQQPEHVEIAQLVVLPVA